MVTQSDIHWKIDIPFPACDAWFEEYTASLQQPQSPLFVKRYTLSLGSVTYECSISPEAKALIIGHLVFRQIPGDQTLLTIVPYENTMPFYDVLLHIAQTFLAFYKEKETRWNTAPFLEASKEMPALSFQIEPPPKKNASVEEWLDWRARSNKIGHHITLEDIAKASRWSLSTIKKRSMNRIKQNSLADNEPNLGSK